MNGTNVINGTGVPAVCNIAGVRRPRVRRPNWSRVKTTPRGWHLLHTYENDGAPGTCWQVTEYVRYVRPNRWTLVTVVDAYPRDPEDVTIERHSSKGIVEMAWERDVVAFDEERDRRRRRGEEVDYDDPPLGPRLRRLLAIATATRARTVVRYLWRLHSGTWPPAPKPSKTIASL